MHDSDCVCVCVSVKNVTIVSCSFFLPVLSSCCRCRLRSPVGPMTVKEQQLEGQLRFVNSRVITNRYMQLRFFESICTTPDS